MMTMKKKPPNDIPEDNMSSTGRFTTITLRPHPLQFVIDKLIMMVLCLSALAYGGMDDYLSTESMYIGLSMLVFLIYKYVKLRRTVYTITGEQLKKAEGVFTRDDDYIELYRVIDFAERKNLLQQLFGLKTVTIMSGDKTTPKLCVQGVKEDFDLVTIIRERVEFTKSQKSIYEITNRY